jgi:hypothetical protein
MLLVTTIAITATVIAFRRFASNERVAYAVAVGVARRRGETAARRPSSSPESSRT